VLKKIVKGSAVIAAGTTVAAGIEYVYYVSMARMLGAGQFGLLSTALAVMWILVTLLTYSVGLSLAKFISEDDNLKKIRALTFNGVMLAYCATLAASLTLLVFAVLVLPSTHASDLALPLVLVAAVLPFFALSTVAVTIFQGLNRMGDYSALTVMHSTIKVASAVALVYAGYGMAGALGAYAVGAAAATIYAFLKLRKFLDARQKLKADLVKKIAFFSAPVAAVTIVIHVLMKSDVIFLKYFGLPNELIGYYTGASLVARFAYFASTSVAIAALPLLSRRKGLRWAELKKPAGLVLAALAAGNLIVAAAPAQIITLFFPADYASVSWVLPPLTLAMSLLALGYIGSTALIARGRPKKTLKPIFAGLIVYVALISALAPRVGLHATYISMIAANLVYLALTLAENKKHIKFQ